MNLDALPWVLLGILALLGPGALVWSMRFVGMHPTDVRHLVSLDSPLRGCGDTWRMDGHHWAPGEPGNGWRSR